MADVGGEKRRVEKTSIDLGVYGKVACDGGRGIRHRISGEKDDRTEIG
jgi:hypothetical protein